MRMYIETRKHIEECTKNSSSQKHKLEKRKRESHQKYEKDLINTILDKLNASVQGSAVLR